MDSSNIGLVIKEIRIQKGLSARHVALCLGIDPSTLSKYESCDRKIKAEMLPKFALVLDVPIEKFFENRIGAMPTE
jgi:transcriptional regulator with XRE-family HTH domain